MDRKIIWLLLGCVGALIIGILLMGMLGSGLDKQLRARATAELSNFSDVETQFTSLRAEVEKAIKDQPSLFDAEQQDLSWTERLDADAKRLSDAAASRDKLTALLEENKRDTRAVVETEMQALSTARQQIWADASEMQETARQLIDFRKQLSSKLPELEADYAAIQNFQLTPLEEAVNKAVADWPDKKTDLNRQLALFHSRVKSASDYWNNTEQNRQRASSDQATGSDIVTLLEAATRLHEVRQSLAGAQKQMGKLIDQLYWSWDKILVDMEIQEGELVTFRQKFQTTRNRVLILPEGKEDEAPAAEMVQDDPVWQTVDKRAYESMKDKLGMSVQHKPAGKFDHEATSLVQPPGYSYMCPPSQRRNSYGYWRPYGGSYLWYYYRPYYPMRRWHWGSDYSPVRNTMYDGYESHRRSGRTYFGSDRLGRPLYGSDGTVTKRNYASSRYVSAGGYKNTQYVKSGGTYRGSRYARTSSRSSSTSRSSTSRSSSSYRSSSYSRSSRSRSGFGGK